MTATLDIPGIGAVTVDAHQQAVLAALLKRDRSGSMPVARSAIDADTLALFEAWGFLGPWRNPPGVVLTASGRKVAEAIEARARA